MKKINKIKQKGQALVTIIIFMLIASIITSAAVAVVITNSVGSSKFQQGIIAKSIAESGIEEALLQLLRNPNYTGTPVGQPLSVGNGNVVVTVNGTIITSTGTYKNFIRKIQVNASYNSSNQLVISNWKESY